MKKFLITFIIGMVFVAIGITSLIFEINDFERVDVNEKLMSDTTYYKSETFTLKENEMVNIGYVDGVYIPFGIHYDDRLGDEVQISVVKSVRYRIADTGVVIYEDDRSDMNSGINALEIFMDGLKQHKLYDFNNAEIVISISHKNRDRINAQYGLES